MTFRPKLMQPVDAFRTWRRAAAGVRHVSFSEDLGRSPSSEDLGAFSRRSPDDDMSYKAGTCVESVDIRRGSRKTSRTLYLSSQIK